MSPRRLVFSRDTDRFLESLVPKQYKQIVSRILDLAEDRRPHDSRKLKCCEEYRVDVGELRIVYSFDNEAFRRPGI